MAGVTGLCQCRQTSVSYAPVGPEVLHATFNAHQGSAPAVA
jgi:hypothetical protein